MPVVWQSKYVLYHITACNMLLQHPECKFSPDLLLYVTVAEHFPAALHSLLLACEEEIGISFGFSCFGGFLLNVKQKTGAV